MDTRFRRRIIAFAYILIILLFIGLGFCYSNESNNYYRENSVSLNDYWKIDGKYITFPFSSDETFTINNTLPIVYGDQLLIIRCYYKAFSVFIDGTEVLESRNNVLFGHNTDVGKKEIWIPLEYEYTGKKVEVKITPQESLYGAELTEAFVTTRSAYVIAQLRNNVPSVVLFILFTVTGFFEMLVSTVFILKRANLIRKLSFEALFYAGAFSIVAGQWIINETRIPFITVGYMTGFSILTIVSFLLMPLLFFEIARCIFLRVELIDHIIDGAIAIVILIACTLASFGIFEWGWLVYVAHVLDIVVMVMVGYYSYSSIKEEKKLSSRTGIAVANGIFIILAGYSLIKYIDNVGYNYIFFIIIALMLYIMVQVGLIYRRIGLNVKEEKEFAQAKIDAYTDQLTGIGNRRHFYTLADDYEKNRLPNDLTYIAIDVNRLKYYNDTLGHDAGDELLKGTATCLKLAFSSSSTSTLSRLGGDEFAILIIANRNELEKRISYLRTQLEHWHGKYVKGISVALGYATVRENPHCNIEDLAKIADNNMYEDKKAFYEKTGYDRRGQSNVQNDV